MSLSFSDAAKAKQLKEYFNRYGRIYIVVDATRDDVIVPEYLKGDPALRLVLNVRMPQPIQIRDDRVVSDFSFSGTIFSCNIPMHTIWGAYLPEGDLEQGIIWDESVPEMIRAIMQAVRSNIDEDETSPDQIAQQPMQPIQSNPAGITVIKGGSTGQPSLQSDETGEAAGDKPKRASHLRVVK